MKLLIALHCLFLFLQPTGPLLILDRELKKPVQTAAAFDVSQYMQKSFPVYAADVHAIVEATDSVVKLLDDETSCYTNDTVTAAHTQFIVSTDCTNGMQSTSVHLMTRIEESNQSFGLTVACRETNKRKIQQKLLDIATYLSK